MQVTHRKVFYVPGYDPFPPRRYRELYRKEGTRQATISGYQMRLTPHTGKHFGWGVEAVIDGAKVHTTFEVLTWSDIVQTSMRMGIFGTYGQMLRTAWLYIGSGTLARLMRLRRGPVIAALYPVLFLIAQAALALALSYGAWGGLARLHPWLGPLGLAALPLTLLWFRRHDNRFFAYYLMHDYAYSAASRGAVPADLDGRMAAFGDDIAAALTSNVDEVLVVGHSSGVHVLVSILADLIRDGRVPKGARLAFLSLGHVVPMVSFLPDAWRLRRDLRDTLHRAQPDVD